VPDRHDLVLSKLVRASQADLVVCREIHEHEPLIADELVHRYLAEMKHAIGRPADLDQNLLAAIELIWDERTADRAQAVVDARRASERARKGRRTVRSKP
jgi:hypothetical protein